MDDDWGYPYDSGNPRTELRVCPESVRNSVISWHQLASLVASPWDADSLEKGNMCSCDWGKIYGKNDQRYLGLKKMINGDSMGISWNRRILYNSMFLNFTIDRWVSHDRLPWRTPATPARRSLKAMPPSSYLMTSQERSCPAGRGEMVLLTSDPW